MPEPRWPEELSSCVMIGSGLEVAFLGDWLRASLLTPRANSPQVLSPIFSAWLQRDI